MFDHRVRASYRLLLFCLAALLLVPMLAPLSEAQNSGNNLGLTPQQMLQSVDVPTRQKLIAASNVIEKNPKDANALVSRAVISLDVADHNPYWFQWVHFAAIDLENALRLDPNNFFAHHNYAMAYYQAGDDSPALPNMHQAIVEFTRAIQLKPDSARSYMGRGWAYLYLVDQPHANADFQKALQLDPSLRDELNRQVTSIQQKLGQRGCVEAMKQRMGAYVVDRNARTAEQCAAHKNYWTGSECRTSTAMAPGPLALGPQDAATANKGLSAGNCSVPRDAVNDKYNPRANGSFVR